MDKTKQELINIRAWCRAQLNITIDFWLRHAMDEENGGVYTCLDRKGEIYSTDKSVWMQGRCAWTFAHLCNVYGKRPEWKKAAKSCLNFLEDYCINKNAGGRLYFTVTGDGKPLRQRRYCFSEGFYAIANAEYYKLTGKEKYLKRARSAYEMIYQLNNCIIEDPTGLGPKTEVQTRSGMALADPMIFLNIINILRSADPAHLDEYNKRSKECVDKIVKNHFHPELKATLEWVNKKGEPCLDFTDGRVVNPGHDIECSWFLMDEANFQKDKELHKTAEQIFRFAIEAGWDTQFGGLLYFIDCLGKPTEAYEHDMKLWWPHNEIMIAASKAFRDTGDVYYLNWLTSTVDYCKKHFVDEKYGEWYGYLRRDGVPTEPSTKGSTFKGPFHVPRALIATERTLTEIIGDEK